MLVATSSSVRVSAFNFSTERQRQISTNQRIRVTTRIRPSYEEKRLNYSTIVTVKQTASDKGLISGSSATGKILCRSPIHVEGQVEKWAHSNISDAGATQMT